MATPIRPDAAEISGVTIGEAVSNAGIEYDLLGKRKNRKSVPVVDVQTVTRQHHDA